MRVALISDLHANIIALEAVLADARHAGYDQLVCLGDVATLGPRPHEVLACLEGLGCRNVLGNHDEFMLEADLIRKYTESPLVVTSVDATRAVLSDIELRFLGTFERTIALDGLFLFHGTPRSNMEDLLATTPTAQVDEMLRGVTAPVFAGGHTHLQMLRQHKGALVVNTGSVGMPFREHAAGGPPVVLAHAEYAIVETDRDRVSVDLRRVPLDRHALAAQVEGWSNPLATSLRALYTH